MTSKTQVLAAARKRYGKKVELRTNKHALPPEGREAERERFRAAKQRCDELRDELKRIGNHWKLLLKVARFAVDVDAQEPSLSQLRAAVEASEHAEAVAEEHTFQYDETKRDSWKRTKCRYDLLRNEGIYYVQVADADTLDELLAKIEQTADAI